MKVAYIVEPRKVIGGGVRAAINLVKALKQYHNENAMIWGTFRGTVKDDAVDLYEIDTLSPISLSYFIQFHHFIKKQSPDVVHCLGLYTALVCVLYKKIFRADYKIVLTVHRVTFNMRFRSLIKFVNNLIQKNASHVTFLTEYQRDHYFNNIHFTPSHYSIIPNVIFVEKLSEDVISKQRQELSSKLNSPLLLSYVGRIIPSKNIEDFIRIISILNKKKINVGGVLVGGYSKEHFEKLQHVIEEEKIAEKILFLGYVNNPTLYTAACDFTLLPTKHGEALPNLLVESFALGKITFSSDIPQMVGLIDNAKNSYTHSLNKLDEFAQQVINIIKDDSLREKISKGALSTYNTSYDPQLVVGKYYSIYTSLMK